MNRLIIPAVIVATAIAGAASSAPSPETQNNRYFLMPLEKDPTRDTGLRVLMGPFTVYDKTNVEAAAQ